MRWWSRSQDALWEAKVWAGALGALLVDAAFDTQSRGLLPWSVRLAPLVVLVLVACAMSVTAPQAVVIGVLGFAFFDGFLVNAYGELTWTRHAGPVQLLAFLCGALAAWLVAQRLAGRRHVAVADLRSSK